MKPLAQSLIVLPSYTVGRQNTAQHDADVDKGQRQDGDDKNANKADNGTVLDKSKGTPDSDRAAHNRQRTHNH